MKKHSDASDNWKILRDRIIGLGERSIHKSYYPELQQRLAELERFRTLLDQSTDSIMVAEIPSGRLEDVNEATCHALGYQRQELLAMTLVDLVPDSLADEIRTLLVDRKAVQPAGRTLSIRFTKRSGDELPVEMSLRRVRSSDAAHAVIVARDITDRQHAEEALRRQNEYLEALHEITLGLMSRLEPGELLQAIVARAAGLMQTKHGFAYLYDSTRDVLELKVGLGYFNDHKGYLLKPGEGLAGKAYQEGSPVAVRDYGAWGGRSMDPRWYPVRSVVAVPVSSQAQVFGVIGLALIDSKRQFGDDEVAVLSRFGQLASVALDNACLYASLQQELNERKRAEQALGANQKLLDAILESTGDGIMVGNPEGTFSYLNSRFAEMWRIPEEALKSGSRQRLLDVAVKQLEDPEGFLARLKELYHSPVECHDSVRFKDGRVFERYSSPLMIEGRVVGRVWSFRDVTKREQTERALKESEEKYRLLVDNAGDAVFIVQDGYLKFPNPKTTELLGYSAQELVTLPFADFITAEDRDLVLDMHRKRLLGEAVPVTYSFRVVTKDGRELWAELSAVLISWDEKPATLNFLRDITPQRQLAAQYRHAQKMQAVGTLAGGIAHDFNNLLQVVQGYAELLCLDRKEGEKGYRELCEITLAARRASELTQQLLTFSRKIESKRRPIDLNVRLRKIHALLQRTIPKMIRIEFHAASDLNPVNADPAQIEQLLMNLALNAKDAMPEGGKITISTGNVLLDADYCRVHVEARPGSHVLLSVSDTGHGMSKETLEHIFEPFYSTKGPGHGTGLGLAMVYGIVKNHEGHVTCHSRPGEGTVFRIYLPAIEQSEEVFDEEMVEDLPGGTGVILLVDDEESIRSFTERMLSRFGYTVLSAVDGESALEIYRRDAVRIDLVILDLFMPGMGGKKCLQELLESDPQVKVIVTSGYSDSVAIEEATTGGARRFVRKPYRMKELLSTVREVMDDGNPAP